MGEWDAEKFSYVRKKIYIRLEIYGEAVRNKFISNKNFRLTVYNFFFDLEALNFDL